jgi:HTH-type transcriptional regulator / antitoxin HipB
MDYVANTPQQLGQVLKGCRNKLGMSQGAVGDKVGVRQSQISVIEANGARATVETLYKVMSALGLEIVIRDKGAGTPFGTEW